MLSMGLISSGVVGGSLPRDGILQERPCVCGLTKWKGSCEPSDSGAQIDRLWRQESEDLGVTGQSGTAFP